MTAFSNHTEFEYWSENWCGRCTKDDMGLAPEGTYCPILELPMCENRVPPEWSPGTDDLRDRYHCSGFEAGGRNEPGRLPVSVIDLDTAAVVSAE